MSIPIKNNSVTDILSKYETKAPQTSSELLGRKILRFLTFGKTSLNPELNKSIRQVLKLTPEVFDSDESMQALESLSKKAESESARRSLKQELDHTIGALKTKDITPEKMGKELEKNDFLTINNPYDSASFALGTFSLFPVDYKGLTFTCAEAAFQAQKFEDPQIQKQFVNLTGIQAQTLVDELKPQIRKNWGDTAVGEMKAILAARSTQNPAYKELLLASKYTFLVAHSRQPTWGDGKGKGQNILGNLLMEERKTLGGTGKVPPPPQYYQEFNIATRNEYKVCSYNLGASDGDYMQLLAKIKKDEPETLNKLWTDPDPTFFKDAEALVAPVRKKLQEEIANFLFDPSKGDVFCLQEVTESNKDLLEILKARGFEIIYMENKSKTVPDSVIAVNKAKFKDIQNQSFLAAHSIDVAMVTAIDKGTGKKTTFVSAHLTPFDIEAKKENIEASQSEGQVRAIVKKVNQTCEDSDMVIFGGDFNASPEIHEGLFHPLMNEGYEIHSTGEATNITTNPKYAREMIERELDHFATKNNLADHTIEVLKTPKEISLDPMSNFSDHLPIFLKVSEEAKKKWFL